MESRAAALACQGNSPMGVVTIGGQLVVRRGGDDIFAGLQQRDDLVGVGVFGLGIWDLLAACSTTSASSARIADLSWQATIPAGGRPTSVAASIPTLAGS
jgi:hypothetical protein